MAAISTEQCSSRCSLFTREQNESCVCKVGINNIVTGSDTGSNTGCNLL